MCILRLIGLIIAVEEADKYFKNENKYIEEVYFIVRDEKLKKAYEFLIDKYLVTES